jgi:hypothetical protein
MNTFPNPKQMRHEGAKARRKTRRREIWFEFFASSFALSRLRGAFEFGCGKTCAGIWGLVIGHSSAQYPPQMSL